MTIYASKPAYNLREKINELHRPMGPAGERMLKTETLEEQQNLLGLRNRNLLINGDFKISQRGNYTSPITYGASEYYIDRWKGGVSGNWTLQHKLNQTLPNGDITNTVLITSTGGAYASIQQWIEDYTTPSGKYITFSFWARTNKWGGYASIYNGPNQWNTSTLIADGDWHYYTHTSYLPTGGTALRPEVWTSVNSVAGDYLEVAQLQLEVGETPTPFEKRFYSEELALCQRYYERINGTTPWFIAHGYGTEVYCNIPFSTSKRNGSGTIFYSNPSNVAAMVTMYGNVASSGGPDGLITGVTSATVTPHSMSFFFNMSASTYTPHGTSVMFRFDSTHWIAYDNEL